MKILLVADGFSATRPEESGPWLKALATGLAHRGHRVTAVLAHAPEDGDADEDSPELTVWRAAAGGLEPVLAQALAQRPDVVHVATAGPWTDAAVRALLDAPLVLDAHGYWPMCAAGDLLRRPALAPCPLAHPHEQCGSCAGLLHLRAMDERAPLGREARAVIAHTAAARERLEAGLGRAVECVRPGVDPFAFAPAAPRSEAVAAALGDGRPPRVLVLGDGGPRRDALSLTDLLVALNARVPGVEMVVPDAGADEPPGAQLLLTEASEMGLERQVRVVRRLPGAELPGLLAACDVACVPGPVPESGGLRVMQALSAGLPVVAHDEGAIAELMTHGVEGLRLPVEPVSAFAGAVAGLLRDPAACGVIGESARLAAMERFDVDRAVFAHEELYHRIRRRDAGARPGAPRRAA